MPNIALSSFVVPGLVPGIHVGPMEWMFALCIPTWIAGTSPAMTVEAPYFLGAIERNLRHDNP